MSKDNGQQVKSHMIFDRNPIEGRKQYARFFDDKTGEYVVAFNNIIIGRSGNTGQANKIALNHAGYF